MHACRRQHCLAHRLGGVPVSRLTCPASHTCQLCPRQQPLVQPRMPLAHLADLKVLALDLFRLALQHREAVCSAANPTGSTHLVGQRGSDKLQCSKLPACTAARHDEASGGAHTAKACSMQHAACSRGSRCCRRRPEGAPAAVHPTERGGQQRAVSRGNRPAPRPTHSCLSVTSSSKATRTSAADSPSCRQKRKQSGHGRRACHFWSGNW